MVSVNRLLKASAQHLAGTVAPFLWRWRAPSLVVMMYHRVLPHTHPDRATEQPGMYVSPETFEMHMHLLRKHFELVHLDDWLDALAENRPLPRHACAVTFDDGWRDNYQYAFPVLERLGVPATVYLVSDLVGSSYSFWPNALAKLVASGSQADTARLPAWLQAVIEETARAGLARGSAAHIDAIINRCKGSRSDEEMLDALREAANPAPAERDLMSWDEIREAHRSGLVRFGSHTRRHQRLTKVRDAEQLRDEIVASREVIAEQLGTPPRTFCYPNGDVSPEALELVRRHYSGAVTTARSWNTAASDKHLLNRVGVHDDVSSTPASFIARLAGVG